MNLTKEELKSINSLTKIVEVQQETGEFPHEFSAPIGLQFELTENCNLNCLHCYNKSGNSKKTTKMTPDEWVKFSEYLVAQGGIFQCILSGGEPLLLCEDLFRIMDVLHNDGTGFVLITNGYLFNREIVSKLKKYRFFWVQVSIDACDSLTHNWFRGKNDSWEKAVQAAFMISSAGLPLTVASSIIPQNLERMDEMADLAYKLGASTIIFGKVIISGNANENREIILNDKQTKMMNQSIKEITIKYQDKMNIKCGSTDVYQLNYHKMFPNKTAIIRPNGDIRLDCTAPFIAGNILTDDFYELWNLKMKKAWENEKVIEYIDKVTNLSFSSRDFINHVDKDILL